MGVSWHQSKERTILHGFVIEPAGTRQATIMTGVLLNVLDYVLTHEWLAIGLAEHAQVHPGAVFAAWDAMAPRERSIEEWFLITPSFDCEEAKGVCPSV